MKFLLPFLFSFCILAEATQLKLLENNTILRRAEFTKAIIETSDQKLVEDLKAIRKSQSIGEVLFLESVGFIQDFPDGKFQVGVLIVLKEIPQTKNIFITIDKNKYELSLEGIGFNPEDATLKTQPLLFEKKYTLRWMKYWVQENIMVVIFLTIFFFIVSSTIWLRLYEKKKAIKKQKEEIKKWKDKILNAHTRKEVEELYERRNQWSGFFKNNYTDEFLNYLNSIQYAPDWSNEEMEKLLVNLDQVKKSIS